jgi:acetyl-CoA acetyltransferase
MTRNPIKDQVAIVGVGSSGFRRDFGDRSCASLAYEAATKAIADAGLAASDIDGITGTTRAGAPPTHKMAAALGIPAVTHYAQTSPVIGFPLVDAMNAVFSGSCDSVLLYHAVYRLPGISRAAASDPFRSSLGWLGTNPMPEDVSRAVGYTAWASRYYHEYRPTREHFGYIAINDRTGAIDNPLAPMSTPITMDDYLAARMVREPLCLLDMDLPVDGADAFVLTTAERARDLPQRPVLIHAATTGLVDRNEEDQLADLQHHGQQIVARTLQEKSDIKLTEADVYFPYDGFTIMTLAWFENIGWCGPGQAGPFIEDHWDATENRILINGKVPVNTHGGALSEGATQGSGHLREAVIQLRGQAGRRQLPGADTALITPGGFFFNSQGIVLRAE